MSKGTRSLKNVGGRTLYVKTNKATSCDKMAPIDCDEPEVAMQFFGNKAVRVCNSLLLLTPNALLNFDKLMAKFDDILRTLKDNPKDKAKIQRFIASNLQDHGFENIKNLEAIEDDHFWFISLPELIGFLKNSLPSLKFFPIIKAKSQGMTDLDRWEIMCLIGCMFLGILPRQAHEETVTFGELMSYKQSWAGNVQQRRQKLMCIIAYFKSFFHNRPIHDEPIRIKRTSNLNKSYLDSEAERCVPLRQMRILKRQEKTTIEGHCGKAIMINPSSKRLGGNVLKSGNSQEDALMLIMPELIVMKLLCEPLQSDEAIIFYGARKYSKLKLKGNQLTFNSMLITQKPSIYKTSVVVSINACDYFGKTDYQYFKKEIFSEINKAYAGFEGAAFEFDNEMPVCTGRWGCSKSNGGDEDLKMLIQWLAASQAHRDIIYVTDSEEKLKEYKNLALELSTLTTLDLLSLLEGFSQVRIKLRRPISVLDYIKYYL